MKNLMKIVFGLLTMPWVALGVVIGLLRVTWELTFEMSWAIGKESRKTIYKLIGKVLLSDKDLNK